ncbi:dihydrodipicolinate synthase family protein [Flavisolibacter ginsenosidimutans]|uniref:Dihydrodipicolinate synthase family protein n=1 Tax=Flavisolibacter ginsenosidimutans TaxID=661481 RepID=A0A5B8UI13_9BACT|nr:dihydrodipicolinate synthase family protein [Flavisolibacter ginsenosidimutans]QEC56168.1 dihydrodipicolinate synthase family protein [Flavisolibacter ginsenosidimutans]
MKKEKKYSGVVIPAVTPFNDKSELDIAAVERMFDNFRKNNVSPFVLGTTGEASSVPTSMKQEFFTAAERLKQSGDVLYAGISSNVFEESVELAKQAFDNGVDVVVATLPSYYALTSDAMLRYFNELADAVNGPLMIYNIPVTTHMSIPLEVIEKLSRHQNIVGLKDSERNEERLNEALLQWKDRDDFSYFLGWAARSAHSLLKGGDGLVPSTGNFHPGLYRDLFEAAKNGNEEKALSLQKLSDTLGNLYQQGRTLGESLWALKVVMKELNLCEPFVLPPLYPQPDEEEKRLQAAFHEIITNKEIILNER